MRKLGLFIIVLFFAFSSKAQLEIGVFGGGSFYMGDLNQNIPFLQTKLAYGVLARYNLDSRWSVKLNIYKGILTGDDNVSKFLEDRSLTFKSSMWELGAVAEFNFLPYYTGSLKYYFTPYIFGGVAVIYNRPKVGLLTLKDYSTEGQNDQRYIDEERTDYSFYNFSIPFGIGFKYSFSKKIAASIEWGMRKTFTDYLDDVSKTYYLPSDQIEPGDDDYDNLQFSDPNMDHQPMMQRGNSKTNDWYSFVGLTLTYNINLRNKNKCSEFEERF